MNKTELAAKELVDKLMEESDHIKDLVIPSLKDTLVAVRDLRMAIDREVNQILNTFNTFRQVSKGTKDIVDFAKAIEDLEATLKRIDPNFKVKMQDLFHE